MSIGRHATFDWSGSLELARRLWTLAERVEAISATRSQQANSALTDWSGQKSTEFASRIDMERAACFQLAEALRHEALGWATEWQKATTYENWVRYQEACQRVRNDRSTFDKVTGLFGGHDDLPPEPVEASQPTSPSFAATRKLADYSNY